VPFYDRAAFLSAVANPVNYNFDVSGGFPAAPASLANFAGGTVQLTTDAGDPAVQLSQYNSTFGQAIGGQVAGAVDNFQAIRMTFLTPVYAVGFDDLDLTPDGVGVITVSVFGGLPPQTCSVTDTDDNFNTSAFFGVISTDPINTIRVYSAEASTAPPGLRANLIDNVVLLGVPEPSSILLAALAAGGLLGFVRVARSKR
jgi:hypothetical protein